MAEDLMSTIIGYKDFLEVLEDLIIDIETLETIYMEEPRFLPEGKADLLLTALFRQLKQLIVSLLLQQRDKGLSLSDEPLDFLSDRLLLSPPFLFCLSLALFASGSGGWRALGPP